MGYQYLLVEKEQGFCTVTLNRPEARNALSLSACIELHDAMEEADQDPEVKVILLTGAGAETFCAGRDLKEYANSTAAPFEDWGQRISERGLNLQFIERMKKPVVAVINGHAIGGGCELALACDMRICSDQARFRLPEIDLDAFPGMGGTWLLPRIVGRSRALKMILTGDWVSASDALQIGLVDQVVPFDRLVSEARSLASKISGKNSWAIQMAKLAVCQSAEMDIKGGRTLSTALRSLAETLTQTKERVSRFETERKMKK